MYHIILSTVLTFLFSFQSINAEIVKAVFHDGDNWYPTILLEEGLVVAGMKSVKPGSTTAQNWLPSDPVEFQTKSISFPNEGISQISILMNMRTKTWVQILQKNSYELKPIEEISNTLIVLGNQLWLTPILLEEWEKNDLAFVFKGKNFTKIINFTRNKSSRAATLLPTEGSQIYTITNISRETQESTSVQLDNDTLWSLAQAEDWDLGDLIIYQRLIPTKSEIGYFINLTHSTTSLAQFDPDSANLDLLVTEKIKDKWGAIRKISFSLRGNLWTVTDEGSGLISSIPNSRHKHFVQWPDGSSLMLGYYSQGSSLQFGVFSLGPFIEKVEPFAPLL